MLLSEVVAGDETYLSAHPKLVRLIADRDYVGEVPFDAIVEEAWNTKTSSGILLLAFLASIETGNAIRYYYSGHMCAWDEGVLESDEDTACWRWDRVLGGAERPTVQCPVHSPKNLSIPS